jgi:hypothetical protein
MKKGLRDYVFFSRLLVVIFIMILKGSYDTVKFFLKNDWSQFGGHIVGLILLSVVICIVLCQYDMISYSKKMYYLMKKKYT